MLDALFKVMGNYGNPVPRYTGPRCLVERMAVGGCDLCQSICPHDAITITSGVEISESACTGCGLCTQICPTGALEFDVTANLGAVQTQRDQSVATLVCSQAGEGGKTIPCLARVTPSLIVAAGAWDTPLDLVRGDCASCKVGGPSVPDQLQDVIERGHALREATERSAQVTVREVPRTAPQDGPTARPNAARGEAVSRRGMFGSMLRSARGVAAELVPDQPLPFVDWSVPAERLPAEWTWRRRALKPTPAPETPVAWPAPTIDEKCIFCPVCANVCPTEAIVREVEADGRVSVSLSLAACTGCGACVRSCPPDAMHLQDLWPERDFAGLVLLRMAED